MKTTLDASSMAIRTTKVGLNLKTLLEQAGIPETESEKLAVKILRAAGILKDPSKSNNKKNKNDKNDKNDDAADNADNAPENSETDALLLMGNDVYAALADLALEAHHSGDVDAWLKDNGNKKRLQNIPKDDKAVDVALFGRMAASANYLNVDAACQFAHAVGVNELNMEDDFFTAVDEVKDSTGAGMIGDIEFNASTLYRYANIDANRLNGRLEDAANTAKAIGAFVEAFAYSMPTGKINTFANRTLPNYLIVTVRSGQPISLVDAFDKPVSDLPIASNAFTRLVEKEAAYENAWGVKPERAWLVAVDTVEADNGVFGQPVVFNILRAQLESYINDRLAA